tara:strand:- start:142 stop:588 length:447 start_codon:yes stop_codon:yes gene_type:complete
MKKRLEREISVFNENNDYCYLVDYRFQENNFEAYFNLLLENRIILVKIICSSSYPFSPPKVLVGCNKYINLLRPYSIIQNYKKELNYNKCMCCNSILCNWTVINTLNNIIEEIKKNFIIKKRLNYLILAKKITYQKLGLNIPIITQFL